MLGLLLAAIVAQVDAGTETMITATRMPRPLGDVPATVIVLGADGVGTLGSPRLFRFGLRLRAHERPEWRSRLRDAP
jgi:hypothetical protein